MANPRLDEKLSMQDILTTLVQVAAAIGSAYLALRTGDPWFLVGLGALAGGSKGTIAGEFAGNILKAVKKTK